MDEAFQNPAGTAKMWKHGRIEPGMGPILWRVWVKDGALKARIERLKGVERVADEWHLHDPSHRAWYFQIPSKMRRRIAELLGIEGVVDRKRQAVAKQLASTGWGAGTRFAPNSQSRGRRRDREPAPVGGESR
jgi:hypothetical protein